MRSGTEASLAATSGIHTAADVLKALLAGADATMMASALLERGAAYLSEVLAEVERWLLDKEYVSVEQLKGSMSRTNIPDASRWERANYTKALVSFTNAHHQHRNG